MRCCRGDDSCTLKGGFLLEHGVPVVHTTELQPLYARCGAWPSCRDYYLVLFLPVSYNKLKVDSKFNTEFPPQYVLSFTLSLFGFATDLDKPFSATVRHDLNEFRLRLLSR